MADEFIISDKIRELATKLGEPDLEGEVDKFLNHHEATGWKRKGGIKIVNKEAALRTWLGNAKTYRDERAQRVYTQDKPLVRSFADRKAMPVQSIPPAQLFTDKPNEDERARVADMLSKLTRKLSAGGKP